MTDLENKDLTIVIPAFNEEDRILLALNDIEENICNLPTTLKEVIIVSDGSTDKTIAVINEWVNCNARNKEIYKVIDYSPNKGKGYAVREGFLAAKGDLVIYTDADGASPIIELKKLFEEIENGADVVCGSRILEGVGSDVHMSIRRRFVGFVFQTILRGLALAKLKDTQCGFKLFKKDVAKALARNQKCFNFSFDIEYLFLANKLGCNIKEVAINWNQVDGSKVNIVNDSMKMLYEVLKIRFVYKYNEV